MEDILRSNLLLVIFLIFSSQSIFAQLKSIDGNKEYWSADSFVGDLSLYLNSDFWKSVGLDVKNQKTWFVGQTYEAFVTPLVLNDEKMFFGLVSPQYLGELASQKKIENLDLYFNELPQGKRDNFLHDVAPVYLNSYMKFDGSIWGLPIDGDCLVLHYRPSFFNNKILQKKFKNKFNRSLEVPQTWEEFDQVTQFFSDNLKAKGIYGNYLFNIDPWVWTFWYSRIASIQSELFDDNMNPTINNQKILRALKEYQELGKNSHPGVEDLSGGAAVKEWANKQVVMTIWWSDLAELSSRIRRENDEDFAVAPLPGVRQADGSILRYGQVPYGRVIVIPSHFSQPIKKKIFNELFNLVSSKEAFNFLANPQFGLDPYLLSHFDNQQLFLESSIKNKSNYKTLKSVKNLLEVSKQETLSALPQPNWPGSYRYFNYLGRAIRQVLMGEVRPEQALIKVETEWIKIRDELGKDEQKKYWLQYRSLLREKTNNR